VDGVKVIVTSDNHYPIEFNFPEEGWDWQNEELTRSKNDDKENIIPFLYETTFPNF